jgi:hypothetical protein
MKKIDIFTVQKNKFAGCENCSCEKKKDCCKKYKKKGVHCKKCPKL